MDSTLINIDWVDEIAQAVDRRAEPSAINEGSMRGESDNHEESCAASVRPKATTREFQVPRASPSLSFGTTTPNGIIDLGRYRGVYGTTFV